MRNLNFALIALLGALLSVGAEYAQYPDTSASGEYGVVIDSQRNLLGESPERCLSSFEPQRFPATGQTTSYVAGDDGAIRAGARLRFRDNRDGTITDKNTRLMWEKKDQSGGLHDWNNTYPWQGTCSNNSAKVCGTDADCVSGGNCVVSGGGMTIFQWLAQLNTSPCFAHHCDWRIPNVKELQSIVDYETYLPPVGAAFNNNCSPGCTVDGADHTDRCSCTQSAGASQGYYWTSSTYAPGLIAHPPGMLAWGVLFGDGDVLSAGKTDHDYVRAVRCGVVRSRVR